MQFIFGFSNETNLLSQIDMFLRTYFHLPTVVNRLVPVDQLVKGLLGSRTRSETSMAALQSLKQTFRSWEAVRDADQAVIFNHIRHTNYPEKKVDHLHQCLCKITQASGHVSLGNLERMSTVEAMQWLETLPGVGRKISASVMNASTWHRRALVIDTHHLRILKRLGLLPRRANFITAYDQIMPQLPAHWTATQIDDHHRLFKRLGQTLCQHTHIQCCKCPLNSMCHRADLSLSGSHEGASALSEWTQPSATKTANR